MLRLARLLRLLWLVPRLNPCFEEFTDNAMVFGTQSPFKPALIIARPVRGVQRHQESRFLALFQTSDHGIFIDTIEDLGLEIEALTLEEIEEIGTMGLKLGEGLYFGLGAMEEAPDGGLVDAVAIGDFLVAESTFFLLEGDGGIKARACAALALIGGHRHVSYIRRVWPCCQEIKRG